MGLLVNFLALMQLIFGAVIPFLSGFVNQWPWYLLSIFICSMSISVFWISRVGKGVSEGEGFVDIERRVDEIMSSNLSWLQPLKFIKQESVAKENRTISDVMVGRYLSSALLVLSLMGICVGGYIIWSPEAASKGLFGALLTFKLGRGVALSMCSYLAISSLSQYLVGVYFLFKKG